MGQSHCRARHRRSGWEQRLHYLHIDTLRPFGAYRLQPTTNPDVTDRGYTGHRQNNTGSYDIGLIYMNARYYVGEIGRFASADIIVPDPQNPQSFNRYTYSYNNPLNFIDYSGRIPCYGFDPGECSWSGLDHHRVPEQRRTQDIAAYTDFVLREVRNPQAGRTDVEVFGRIMNFAAGFGTSTREWANDITYVVNGTTGPLTLLTALPGEQTPQFGDTGFNLVYRDGQNQIYHWWAYVNTAVQGGFFWANTFGYIGNEVHEFWDFRETFRQPQSGSSWEDYALAENGMSFGLSLHYGYTSPENAGDVAQWMLATDQQRPIVRWMSEHIGNYAIPTNVLRSIIETLR